MTSIEFADVLMSFGHGTKAEKKDFLRRHEGKKVYMDLTCFDPAEFYAEFSCLRGSFAALFCDEQKRIEAHFRERDERVLKKFSELGFVPVETTIVSCGFIFPRTIVQIINEAHFVLEEGVASRADIDRAMRFGVNYPKGPFEWAKGREQSVQLLLSELLAKTGDSRYRPSSLITAS